MKFLSNYKRIPLFFAIFLIISHQLLNALSRNDHNKEIGAAKAQEFEEKALAAKHYLNAKVHAGQATVYRGLRRCKKAAEKTRNKLQTQSQQANDTSEIKDKANKVYTTAAEKTNDAADKVKEFGQEVVGAGQQLSQDLTDNQSLKTDEPPELEKGKEIVQSAVKKGKKAVQSGVEKAKKAATKTYASHEEHIEDIKRRTVKLTQESAVLIAETIELIEVFLKDMHKEISNSSQKQTNKDQA